MERARGAHATSIAETFGAGARRRDERASWRCGLAGPLILTEPESTLVVAYPAVVRVLDSGTVEVQLGEDA